MEYISLGSHCYPAWLIERMGLRNAAYPFDWLFSDPRMILDCLRDRCSTLLNPIYHQKVDAHRSNHTLYGPRFGHTSVFNHHDITHPDTAAHFSRAVGRMEEILSSSEDVQLVLMAPQLRLSDQIFHELVHELTLRNPSNDLVAIRLHGSGDGLGMVPPEGRSNPREVKLTIKIDNGRLYEFRPQSDMQGGMAFEDESDNSALERLIVS